MVRDYEAASRRHWSQHVLVDDGNQTEGIRVRTTGVGGSTAPAVGLTKLYERINLYYYDYYFKYKLSRETKVRTANRHVDSVSTRQSQ